MPSVKILEQKKKVVKELRKELETAKSMVFTDYMGLNVAQDTEMRTAFRKEGLEYRVIKNTITTRVFDEMGLEDLKSILVGPTAVAYSSEDPILAPRLVVKYRDQFKKFSLKGGVMDGEIISNEEIEELANIPALPILHGRLVSTLLFPISSLAITLNLLAKKAEEAGAENVAELAADATAPEAAEAKPEAKAEEPATEEPVAAEAKPEAKAEEPATEEPVAAEVKPEAKAEEPVTEEPVAAEAKPEAKAEEPVTEEPVAAEAKPEAKAEEPATEEPMTAEAKPEAVAAEEDAETKPEDTPAE